jgi:hypothetical protein
MWERRFEQHRHIGTSNSIAKGKWQRLLRQVDEVLPTRSVQNHTGSDDGVIQAARTNLLLDAPAPDERVAFP